jgi:hypothetical protein
LAIGSVNRTSACESASPRVGRRETIPPRLQIGVSRRENCQNRDLLDSRIFRIAKKRRPDTACLTACLSADRVIGSRHKPRSVAHGTAVARLGRVTTGSEPAAHLVGKTLTPACGTQGGKRPGSRRPWAGRPQGSPLPSCKSMNLVNPDSDSLLKVGRSGIPSLSGILFSIGKICTPNLAWLELSVKPETLKLKP